MKKRLGMIAAVLVVPTLAWADDAASFNCDFQPSCEVAPGIYGKMASPVQSKFKLSVGGFVRLDYAYNSVNLGTGGFQSPDGTVPSKGLGRNDSSNAANQNQSILTARTSRLWFKSTGPDFLGAKTAAMIEGDFVGDASAATESPMFRLRLAHATLDWKNVQLLFGEEWDIFGPMVASSIDFRNGTAYGTPNSQRVPQIRVKTKLELNSDNAVNLVLGVQDPNQLGNNQSAATGSYGPGVNVAGQLSLVSKSLGTAPGFYGYSLRPFTATLFGLYGSEKAASNDSHSIDSYGYGLYTFVPLLSSPDGKTRRGSVSFEGEAYGAANMAFNHATAQAVVGTPGVAATQSAAAVPGISNVFNPNGKQSPAKGLGYAAQLIAYPTQDLGITLGYGTRIARDYDSYAGYANFQDSTSSLYANLAYDLNAAVRVATEYQHLNTKYGNANGVVGANAAGNDNTIRFVALYFF